jgi:hypothetical protein
MSRIRHFIEALTQTKFFLNAWGAGYFGFSFIFS